MKTNTIVLMLVMLSAVADAQFWRELPNSQDSVDELAAWRRGYFEGYTQSPSIAQGDTVKFKVSTIAAFVAPNRDTTVECAMKVYRVTGRTMVGDELKAVMPNFTATFYPLTDSIGGPINPGDMHGFPRDYKIGCTWATATSFSIPEDWQSGYYYAKLFLPDSENVPTKVGYIPFIVKSALPGFSSKILYAVPWNTYQAYNYWGGGSLYWWTGLGGGYEHNRLGEGLVRRVSFRRPFITHHSAPWPASDQLGQVNLFPSERTFIAWALENNYSMEFCVDADLSLLPTDGTFPWGNYRTIIIPGHSEYWTQWQRDNFERADRYKSTGGNFAFFAANNCYWRVKYLPGDIPTNNPDSMYCDKDTADVHGGVGLWRRQVGAHGEAHFLGVQFHGTNDPDSNRRSIVRKHEHWIFKNTGLANGQEFGYGIPLATGELDMVRDTISPSNTEILGRVFMRRITDGHEAHYGEVDSMFADVAYYEDIQTNSRVFSAGGLGWNGCLIACSDSGVIQTMTKNILDHFSGKKYIGNVYASLLEWNQDRLGRDTVEVDGNTTVLGGKQLRVDNGMKIIIDSAVALHVGGEMQIPSGATATITGFNNKWGNLVINNGGTLRVKSGATLKLNAPLYFVLEQGSNLALEGGATLKINTTASTADSVVINVPSNATLRFDSLAQMYFGVHSLINVSGTLVAQGTSANPVLLTRSNSNNDYWSGITLNEFASATLSHCNILHAQVGVSANSIQPSIAVASSKDDE